MSRLKDKWVGRVDLSVMPGAGRKTWQVDSPLTFIDDEYQITVTPGATTDGASIPRMFWRLIGGPFSGKYIAAALIHDQLYATQGYAGQFTREEVDQIFHRAMLSVGVSGWRARLMYWAVRAGGGSGWDRHDEHSVLAEMEHIEVVRK
ncbi:MAG: DUF1353 domain-containing protein [Candidatus Thiodiazotropha sp. (ex Troendleina suluensis)]|nr:DUF1353 domain-containing protein [Candidatus Thiodiazotropha sp. (ex Troendleina suluensis)]